MSEIEWLEVGTSMQINDGPWLAVPEWNQERGTFDTGDPDLGVLPGPWLPAQAVATAESPNDLGSLPSLRVERVPLRIKTETGEEYDASGCVTYVDKSGRIEVTDIIAGRSDATCTNVAPIQPSESP